MPCTDESPKREKTLIDINSTARLHHTIVPCLLSAHALTGCDTVASLFGIGKGTTIKVLQQGDNRLSMLGNSSLPVTRYDSMVEEATKFILACHSQPQTETLTEARKCAWRTKMAKWIAEPPKLCSLPPTTEAFRQNALRAHLQVAVWRHALQADPPILDPLQHEWTLVGTVLTPRLVAEGVPLTLPNSYHW